MWDIIEYKCGPLVADFRLQSSRKASLADCCLQAVDIQSTYKNTIIFKCQCIFCGHECTAFSANDNAGSYNWNDSHLIKCHNVKGGQLFASFSPLMLAHISKRKKARDYGRVVEKENGCRLLLSRRTGLSGVLRKSVASIQEVV